MGGGRRPPGLGPHGNRHGRHAQRQQGIAVAGVSGLQHSDPVADVEHREEGQRESGRCPGNDDHALVADTRVAIGDAPPQRVQPAGVGVAEGLVEMGPNRLPGEHRERGGRLAHLEVHDPPPRGLERARLPAHRHRMERWHGGSTHSGFDHVAIVALPAPATQPPRIRQGFLTLHAPDVDHEWC